MSNADIHSLQSEIFFLPVETRVPLKFGKETLTHVTCIRVSLMVEDNNGKKVTGWGETPLSAQWAWPSNIIPLSERLAAMKDFCRILAQSWADFDMKGHPVEIGYTFIESRMPDLLKSYNQKKRKDKESMPWLAALICCSAFDIALHDAYGRIYECPTYNTYCDEFMNKDLDYYLTPAENTDISFSGVYPDRFLRDQPLTKLPAWHLVGGKDLLYASELTGDEPHDGYPVLLEDWIKKDDLKCLKIKLRGDNSQWDYDRLVEVGRIARDNGVYWLSSDFNCNVTEPDYVNDILDRLLKEYPAIYSMILYVEQPFPYDLKNSRIDVRSVAGRKPLFMDESAHDWRYIKLGRELGWTGVALKTCKTQTGALLSLCWAKAHGMTLMVQDLTNPMLAQIPHVLLAAHADTIMGVETNAMQFYPEASDPEAQIHPGLYKRRGGQIDLSSITGPGFGYRINEISRKLPEGDLF